jgi:hypothetical protein
VPAIARDALRVIRVCRSWHPLVGLKPREDPAGNVDKIVGVAQR